MKVKKHSQKPQKIFCGIGQVLKIINNKKHGLKLVFAKDTLATNFPLPDELEEANYDIIMDLFTKKQLLKANVCPQDIVWFKSIIYKNKLITHIMSKNTDYTMMDPNGKLIKNDKTLWYP